jgi:uncharacterized protein
MSQATLDQQFVEFVVMSIVSRPEAVVVVRSVDDKGVLLELTVDPEDLGRVIGKRGGTAQSIRTLLRALGTKNEERYNLKIVDNGVPRAEREDRAEFGGMSSRPAAADDDDTTQDDTTVVAPVTITESDAVTKTRAELSELDDLDI